MHPIKSKTDHPTSRPSWMDDLGLLPGWGWLADLRFGLALLAGVLFWLVLAFLGKAGSTVELVPLVSLVLVQPLVEELLFRGVLQGQLMTQSWGRRQLGGFTLANLAASVLFTALHFASHPPLWAIGVLLPSLLYGYFRDRHHSVYPAIALHVFYNAGYFLIPLI